MTVPCQGAEAPSAREGLCGANRVKSAEVPTNVKEVVARFVLTVIGLLVDSLLQRQVRLYLGSQAQQVPGNTGATATPRVAVVLALLAQVALGQFGIDDHEVAQVYGLQPHHLRICDALGLDHAWYEAPSVYKIDQFSQSP